MKLPQPSHVGLDADRQLGVLSGKLKALASALYASGPLLSQLPATGLAGGASFHAVPDADATPDGRFLVTAIMGGRLVGMLVDTGAAICALPAGLVASIDGLVPLDSRGVRTASGALWADRVGLESMVLAGRFEVSRVTFAVLDQAGEHPILGMDVLRQLRYSFDGPELRLIGLAGHRR